MNTYHNISNDIARPIERKATKGWWLAFAIACSAAAWGGWCMWLTVSQGIGVWGLNNTVQWAWDITNFVWWIGIGHAGTFISAILLLFRQRWRVAINRSAEAMTIFAVIQAGIYPILHMGRPWLLHFMLPVPNQYGSLWDNMNSPLLWDVFAIATYFSVSLVFWWVGLLPDFAMLRDRAVKPLQRHIYGILSFGWSGRAKEWQRLELVVLLLAGIATPLVISVHTIVSFDFATSVIPGWHTTIFPPYFVAGAIFSGFAMVSLLLIILRKVCKLQQYITLQHINLINSIILVTGSLVAVAYLTELFVALLSGNPHELFVFSNRATGAYAWAFWLMIICNVCLPQLLWLKKLRQSIAFSVFIAIVVCVGMWFERFVIIVGSLHKDYLPSSWTLFSPSYVDIGIFIGTLGLFLALFLLYARTFPMIAQWEIKAVTPVIGDKEMVNNTNSETIECATAEELLLTVSQLKKEKVAIKEVYTPFAVEGLDKALGIKESRLGKATFVYGCLGLLFGSWPCYYTMIESWPQNFGGKPNETFWQNLPSFVPIIFEFIVYFSAHLLVLSFLWRSRLFPFQKATNPIKKSTDNKFVITRVLPLVGLLLLASCRNNELPTATFAPDMYESAAYEAYELPPLAPPANTIKRGDLPYPYPNTLEGYEQAKKQLQNPLATDSLQRSQHLTQGKALYDIYCALCHGEKGDGKGILIERGKIFGVPNYKNIDITAGSIYHVIYYGRNAMNDFATQLTEKERWQVSMYVQKMQGNN